MMSKLAVRPAQHADAPAIAAIKEIGRPGVSSLAAEREVRLQPPTPASLPIHARLGFQEVGVLTVPDGRTVSLRRRDLLEVDGMGHLGAESTTEAA